MSFISVILLLWRCSMQQKLTEGKLLHNGKLAQAGYSTKTLRRYERSQIKGHKWKIKEWDYYIITDGKRAVALTVADNSYMSLVSGKIYYPTQNA